MVSENGLLALLVLPVEEESVLKLRPSQVLLAAHSSGLVAILLALATATFRVIESTIRASRPMLLSVASLLVVVQLGNSEHGQLRSVRFVLFLIIRFGLCVRLNRVTIVLRPGALAQLSAASSIPLLPLRQARSRVTLLIRLLVAKLEVGPSTTSRL